MFCPTAIQSHTSVYSAFCIVNATYTANDTKQRTRLYRCFSCYLTHSTAHDTRPTQADIIPPAPRRTLHKSAQPPIIIRYIGGGAAVQHTADHASPAGSAAAVCGSLASAAPGAPAEGSALPSVPGRPGGLQSGTGQRSGRTGSAWHLLPGGAVQQQERGGAARNYWRLLPHLFSGFRPIANRG